MSEINQEGQALEDTGFENEGLGYEDVPVADHGVSQSETYQVDWERPFFVTDTIRFSVAEETALDLSIAKSDLDSIRVVPNPYVMTNMMESAVGNPFLNQRRRLMFTHVPADCIIKIFTVSGVLVDEIHVSNTPENGIIHWDMLTRENLEIAAGMYIYHIDANSIGEEKVGKFAVIK